ncbi:PREDICTED: arginine-glutamic acid dipeptide repeats protein-like [Amphimedon queenslandica]|uniref:Arginine-glutamic acid dipeptide repeats protein n=1 Tax=Amphimedon queenslandica TaxID=400682 RepID=A0A1X7VGQ5_AMPQE|nr:PREDICTED: arginine-glutamic acid dipeptide repeats protein-like [Amphimedon queenslandica]|eukprot:XP_019848994.1 PREDICTED: arginine-glutamic acid dipeptide repeats protein-like [Amphimedon queenslandica]
MPGKNFKKQDPRNGKKGRKTRGNSAPVPPSASSSKMSNKPPPSSSGAQTRGRRTNNSQKGRPPVPAAANKPPPVSAPPPNSKKNGGSNGKGGPGGSMKSKKKTPDYSCYTAEDQTVYKPGDYAYVDSQQSDQPYHICLINSFKGTRKDTVTAEVKWFYRVCELPEAVYYQLMEDRKLSEYAATFALTSIRDRELFAAFNVDTHPAHLFRGKCVVEEFSTITDMASFLPLENHFFYQHGYKPESRRMTKMDEFSFIPYSQQAELPDYKPFSDSEEKEDSNKQDGEHKETKKLDRYSVSDQTSPPSETLIWKTNIDDDNLLMYLRAARSVALHAGVCMQGLVRDGYMAASSDETTQRAFDVLHSNDYDTEKALLAIIKKPNVGKLHRKKNWSKEHSLLFAKGMRQFGKNFRKIKNELLPNKEITELIEYYYYWKKTTAGLSSRNTRKQRKQFHIRMSRAMMKPEDKSPEPEKEFIDVSSGEEDEMIDDEGEKCFVYHACRHCYSTESSSWHHSGSNKTILCNDCRLYFRKYSCMRPLTVKREPPAFMFKDYHVALAEESRRKTRNSNNVRLPHAGLRNGKIFSKSDSDEDEEGSETSEFSSTESFEVPISTKKRNRELQQRRSLMDLLDNDNKTAANISGGMAGGGASEGEASASSEPSEKKIKEEKDQQREGAASDEDGGGSGPSTSYARDDDEFEEGVMEEEDDNGRKSLEEQQSSSQSPESSGEERTGPLSATTPKSSVPFSKAFQTLTHTPIPQNPIPQSFMRVSKDTESSCARTDLVYVHPSPEERKALAQPQKAIPHHIPHLSFGQPELPPSNPIPPAPQLQTQTTSTKQQVPTITTYDPHLPSGPGHFIGFPMPPALTPTIPPGADPASIVAMARQFPPHMAREDIFIWQQQQQQQQALAMAMQKQLETGAAQHVAFQPGAGGPHILQSATEHGNQQQQGMIFQFPTPEEMTRLQRSGHTLHSLPEGVIAAHPHHPFHPIVATPTIVMDTGAHHHDDGPSSSSSHHHQPGAHHHPHQPLSLSLLPNNMVAANLEALQQQQQQQLLLQQQQNPQVALISQEHFQDLQRRYLLYMQEYQKNPSIINNPNFQNVVSQYQQLEQYILLQQQQQQQQQQELLLQQELLKHQQQQQQKYAHQSSSGSSTSSSAAARPGVIMNLHTTGNRS